MEQLLKKFQDNQLTDSDRLEFLEELYWGDLEDIEAEKPELKADILKFLQEDTFSSQELSLILMLYNNPSGAWVDDFSHLIGGLYKKDRLAFIKGLHLAPDEINNLVYLFRNDKVFEDEDIEEKQLLSEESLSEEEKETVQQFFRMYQTVCSA